MLLSVSSGVESVARFITVLILFLFVCVLTYYTTRFTASYQKGRLKTSNIEVIEAFRIANNKYIQIVRIGEKYMAICVCKDTVTLLCELTEDEIIHTGQQDNAMTVDFKELFEKMKQRKNTKKQADKDE